MSLLSNIERLYRCDVSRFTPFAVDGRRVGWVAPERKKVLERFPCVFDVSDAGIEVSPRLASPCARSEAIAAIANDLHASGLFLRPRGEMYAVKTDWNASEVMRIDRALVVGFGVRAYGVHVNGFVRTDADLAIWIGTRALTIAVEPGKLDNMVAGGQPADLSVMDNVVKECAEEAGLPEPLARAAVAAGTLRYCFSVPEGLKDDVLFCFDLELPRGLKPKNQDGEIAQFELVPIATALHWIAETERFKFNVGAVIIDFAIRHGALTPDREPDYALLRERLYSNS